MRAACDSGSRRFRAAGHRAPRYGVNDLSHTSEKIMAGKIVMRTAEALVEGDKDYLCADPRFGCETPRRVVPGCGVTAARWRP